MADLLIRLLPRRSTRPVSTGPDPAAPDVVPAPTPAPTASTPGPRVQPGAIGGSMRAVWPDASFVTEPCWRDHCRQPPVNDALLCAGHTAEMRAWSTEAGTIEEVS